MGCKIANKNPGALKEIARRMGAPMAVRVGLQGGPGEKDHGGLTVVALGTIHEFGAGHIPPRPFIRGWFDAAEVEAREKMRFISRKAIGGENPAALLTAFGMWAQSGIQSYISAGIEPPNAAATVQRKESSTPLIDTGILRASITFVVEGDSTEVVL